MTWRVAIQLVVTDLEADERIQVGESTALALVLGFAEALLAEAQERAEQASDVDAALAMVAKARVAELEAVVADLLLLSGGRALETMRVLKLVPPPGRGGEVQP